MLDSDVCSRVGFHHQALVVDQWWIVTRMYHNPKNYRFHYFQKQPGSCGFCDAPIISSLQVENEAEAISRTRQHRWFQWGPVEVVDKAVSV